MYKSKWPNLLKIKYAIKLYLHSNPNLIQSKLIYVRPNSNKLTNNNKINHTFKIVLSVKNCENRIMVPKNKLISLEKTWGL